MHMMRQARERPEEAVLEWTVVGYGPFQQPFYVDTFATIDTRITRLFIGPYPQPSKNTRWAQSGSLGPAPYTPCRGSRAFCRRRRSRALPCYSRHRISTPRLDASSTPTTRAPIVIPYYQTRYELIWEPRAGVQGGRVYDMAFDIFEACGGKAVIPTLYCSCGG